MTGDEDKSAVKEMARSRKNVISSIIKSAVHLYVSSIIKKTMSASSPWKKH
jgi:hypothetical protein